MKIITNSKLCSIADIACGEVFQTGNSYLMRVYRANGLPKNQIPAVNLETGLIHFLGEHEMVEPLPNAGLHI